MISVNEVYTMINNLARKTKGGYTSTDEFNLVSKLSEYVLYDYYLESAEVSNRISEALRPFVKEAVISQSGGLYALPSDYQQKISFEVQLIENQPDCETPSVEWCPGTFLDTHEDELVQKSAIRRASLDKKKFNGIFVQTDSLKVRPSSFTGRISLKYYAQPVVAFRGYTVNPVNEDEDYDPGTSTDYSWNVLEQSNIIDLLLFYKGLSIRESAIINWVQAKKSSGVMPESLQPFTKR